MYLVVNEKGPSSLFLSFPTQKQYCSIHKLRFLQKDEQSNTVAYASVSLDDPEVIALFLDYVKASLYASRHNSIVKNLVIQIE